MIYAVMADIKLTTAGQQDNLLTNIKNKLVGRTLWSDENNPNQLDKGKLNVNAVLRFVTEAEQMEVATYIRDRMAQIPALSGSVRVHKCHHDTGSQSCEQEIEI